MAAAIRSGIPPRVRGRAQGVSWTLALALGASGCAEMEVKRSPFQSHPTFSGATSAARANREAQMNEKWRNKSLDDLVGGLGKPKMVMRIPGGGMPPSFAVVYGRDDHTGCIDAFAVSSVGEAVVRIYHCR